MATELTQLRRALTRAARQYDDAAYVYAETLRQYRRLRSDRTRAEAYRYLVDAYADALVAYQRAGRAAAAVRDVGIRREPFEDVPKRLEGVFPIGTEFELTATTTGGTPKRKEKKGRRR